MYAQGPMSTSIASNGPLPLITYVILYHVLYCTLLFSVTGENKPKPKNLNLYTQTKKRPVEGLHFSLDPVFLSV